MPANLSLLGAFAYNKLFVETGTCAGDTVQRALDVGYERVVSVELSDEYYDFSARRFAKNKRVRLWHGNSVDLLPEILKSVNEPATFWLDAHHSSGVTAGAGVDQADTIAAELEQIEKTLTCSWHTILIDDQNGHWNAGIVARLMAINPAYKIGFVDSWWDETEHYYPKCVLVAEPPNRKRKHEIIQTNSQ